MNILNLWDLYINNDDFYNIIWRISDIEDKSIDSYLSRIRKYAKKKDMYDLFTQRREYYKSKKSVAKYNKMLKYYYIYLDYGYNEEELKDYLRFNNINRAEYNSVMDSFLNSYATDKQIETYKKIKEIGNSNTRNNIKKRSKYKQQKAFLTALKFKINNICIKDNINENQAIFFGYISRYLKTYATEEEKLIYKYVYNNRKNVNIHESLAEMFYNVWEELNYNILEVYSRYTKYGFTESLISLYIVSYYRHNTRNIIFEKKGYDPNDLLTIFYKINGDLNIIFTLCPYLGLTMREYSREIGKILGQDKNEKEKYKEFMKSNKPKEYVYIKKDIN